MRAPTNNPVTQGKHGNYNAVDYSYLPDSCIYAPESGTITFYGNAGDCGNNLQLTAGNRVHGFCHLQNALVTVGQKVTKGQKIGIMGYTGYTIPKGKAGSHLHWVVRVGNTYVYPPTLVTEPFGGNQTKPTTQGGNQVFNNDKEVQEAYRFLRGNAGTVAERKGWIGQSKQRFFQVGLKEADSYRAERDALRKQLADVQKALANEKAKPPKEVVKVVEKIVEKPVEVPTGGVDAETKAEISAIRAGVDWIKALLTKVFKG